MDDPVDRSGRLFVISGPSGVGKDSLIACAIERLPNLRRSVSMTTRTMRASERDGKDYYFATRDRFNELAEAGEFLEWAEYAGNLYGTPRGPVAEDLAQGRDVLLKIEVQGARLVKDAMSAAILVFLAPPSMSELEARLRSRGTEDESHLRSRLKEAEIEMHAIHEFDIVIVNDHLQDAVESFVSALTQATTVHPEVEAT